MKPRRSTAMVGNSICSSTVVTLILLAGSTVLAQAPVTTTIVRGNTTTAGTPIPLPGPAKEARPATSPTVKPVGSSNPAPPSTAQKGTVSPTQQTNIVRGNNSSQTSGPTISAWTQQNPSGIQNRQPVDGWYGAPRATNNYFGPQFRNWNGMSAPVSLPQMPASYHKPTPLNQSNLMQAPMTWHGPQAASWSNMRIGTAVADPRGGYNYQTGP